MVRSAREKSGGHSSGQHHCKKIFSASLGKDFSVQHWKIVFFFSAATGQLLSWSSSKCLFVFLVDAC